MFFFRNTLSVLLVSVALGTLPSSAEMNHASREHGGMATTDMPDHNRATHVFEGTGTVVAIDMTARKIGLDHGPVPALKWPPMRMAFKVGDGIDLSPFKKGDQVQFTLHKVEKGAYPIVELCEASGPEIVPRLCAPDGDQMPMPNTSGN